LKIKGKNEYHLRHQSKLLIDYDTLPKRFRRTIVKMHHVLSVS